MKPRISILSQISIQIVLILIGILLFSSSGTIEYLFGIISFGVAVIIPIAVPMSKPN